MEENKIEQLDDKEIKLTSINEEAIKKLPKKNFLQKNLAKFVLIGSFSFVGYILYENIQQQNEIYNQIPTPNELIEIPLENQEIIQLKEEYKTGYYLYEVLTDEEINKQFQAIMKFQTEQWNKYRNTDMSEGYVDQYGIFYINQYIGKLLDFILMNDQKYLKPFLLENGEYSKYFNRGGSVENAGGFEFSMEELTTYYSNNEDYVKSIDNISMEAKSFYVKYWKYIYATIKEAVNYYHLEDAYMEYSEDFSANGLTSSIPHIKIYI